MDGWMDEWMNDQMYTVQCIYIYSLVNQLTVVYLISERIIRQQRLRLQLRGRVLHWCYWADDPPKATGMANLTTFIVDGFEAPKLMFVLWFFVNKMGKPKKKSVDGLGHFDAGTWCADKDQLNRTVYVSTFNYSCFPRHPPMMSHPPTVRGFGRGEYPSNGRCPLVMGDRVTWFVPLMLIVGFVVDICTVWRVNMNQVIP